jgi:hypothetical protein
MAKVTITVEDDPDGKHVNIRIESDPPWPGPAAEDQSMTCAQNLGLAIMEKMPEITGDRVYSIEAEEYLAVKKDREPDDD